MPRWPSSHIQLAEVSAFADQYLAQTGAIERSKFRRIGLNPDDARGMLLPRDIARAFNCSHNSALRLFKKLLDSFPEKYECIQYNGHKLAIIPKKHIPSVE